MQQPVTHIINETPSTCLVKDVNVKFVLQLLRSWEKFPRYLRDVRLAGTPGLRLDLIKKKKVLQTRACQKIVIIYYQNST